jgi:hypothetical protein
MIRSSSCPPWQPDNTGHARRRSRRPRRCYTTPRDRHHLFRLTGASGSLIGVAVARDLAKRAVSPWEPLHGWRRLPNQSSCDYRHIVQNGRLVGNRGSRRTLHPPRPCVAGVACVAQELSRPGRNILQYTQEWNLRKLRGSLAKGGGKRRSVKPW